MRYLTILLILLSGCQAFSPAPAFTPEQRAEAEAVIAGVYTLPHTDLLFACNRWQEIERIDGCFTIVGERGEVFLWEGLPDQRMQDEYWHQVGHVYNRLIERGTVRDARTHSYINLQRTVRAE